MRPGDAPRREPYNRYTWGVSGTPLKNMTEKYLAFTWGLFGGPLLPRGPFHVTPPGDFPIFRGENGENKKLVGGFNPLEKY